MLRRTVLHSDFNTRGYIQVGCRALKIYNVFTKPSHRARVWVWQERDFHVTYPFVPLFAEHPQNDYFSFFFLPDCQFPARFVEFAHIILTSFFGYLPLSFVLLSWRHFSQASDSWLSLWSPCYDTYDSWPTSIGWLFWTWLTSPNCGVQ